MKVQYTNKKTEGYWGARISQINQVIRVIEVASVGELRKSAITAVQPGHLVPVALHGASVFFRRVAPNTDYIANYELPKEGEEYVGQFFITQGSSIPKNDAMMGLSLGYPECCISYFTKHYGNPFHDLDLTRDSEAWSRVDPLSNTILKPLGIRPVFHIPCSPNCESTRSFAEKLFALAREKGYGEQIDHMYHLLSQPMTISTQNGVVEIIHSYFRLTYETDFQESISFKINQRPASDGVAQMAFIKQAQEEHKRNVPSANDSLWIELLWKDNGFGNMRDMDEAHKPTVVACYRFGGRITDVVDIGAGNGFLINKVSQLLGVPGTAIEIEEDKVARGKIMFPHIAWLRGDMKEYVGHHDLVLISARRFSDTPKSLSNIFEVIRPKFAVAYIYDDEPVDTYNGEDYDLEVGSKVHIYTRRD